MKKVFLTIITITLFSNLSLSQTMDKYKELVKVAWGLYESKDFKESADKYNEAFESNEGKAYLDDRYNASCSYALAGNSDKAFYHLFRLAEHPLMKYRNYNHITTDRDLNSLHSNARWLKLINIVKANKEEAEKDLDKHLVAILDTIYLEDQKYRRQIDEIKEKYSWDSDEMKSHWKIINEKDSINLIKVVEILDKRGWLGANIIGEEGNSTLFLVIQHSNIETQLKYLPMMREAVKLGNARGNSLAFLEDRVALGQGKRQIYGSQIHSDKKGEMYVAALIDPENVDERRAEVGLGPISKYISYWQLTWDVEKHKKRIAELENGKGNE
jgi:hypothetical protein